MKKHVIRIALSLSLGLFLLVSCEKEETKETLVPPTISFESEESEYRVKTGGSVILAAVVENAVNPTYSWKIGGKIVGNEPHFTFIGEKVGEYFVNFRVDAENGSAEAQVKISVLDKLPPQITLPAAAIAFKNIAKEFVAEVSDAENATYVWRKDGKIVSETATYTFIESTLGDYSLSLKVTTAEGQDLKAVTVTVLPEPLPELYFDNGRYRVTSNTAERRTMTVPIGKSLVLAPVIRNIDNPTTFVWTVNGATQAATGEYFTFTPPAEGAYLVTVTEQSTNATGEVEVTCTPPEGTYRRTSGVKNHATDAFYYIPAPGQYIGSMSGKTIASALQDVQAWCTKGIDTYCMIGSFGGYYIVGFDHSVSNEPDKADLQINGNPFAGWCESGIVWVMQDENGNGQPDDTWYELKGSETGKPATKQRYALTYYRPKDISSSVVAWTDNMGKSGAAGRGGYPRIIVEDYYTLTGTCLASTALETGGISYSECYDWGYVDGINSSPLRPTTGHFWIEDAIQADGSPARLQYIDFVKVHTAINAMTKNVGEISTEAKMPYDLNF